MDAIDKFLPAGDTSGRGPIVGFCTERNSLTLRTLGRQRLRTGV